MIINDAKRQRGRPRRDEPMERIDVRLPISEYDRIIRLARYRGESVSSTTRTLLITRARKEYSSVKK